MYIMGVLTPQMSTPPSARMHLAIRETHSKEVIQGGQLHSGANLRSDLLARVVRSQGPLDSFVADPGTSDAYCTVTASLLRKWSA